MAVSTNLTIVFVRSWIRDADDDDPSLFVFIKISSITYFSNDKENSTSKVGEKNLSNAIPILGAKMDEITV